MVSVKRRTGEKKDATVAMEETERKTRIDREDGQHREKLERLGLDNDLGRWFCAVSRQICCYAVEGHPAADGPRSRTRVNILGDGTVAKGLTAKICPPRDGRRERWRPSQKRKKEPMD